MKDQATRDEQTVEIGVALAAVVLAALTLAAFAVARQVLGSGEAELVMGGLLALLFHRVLRR